MESAAVADTKSIVTSKGDGPANGEGESSVRKSWAMLRASRSFKDRIESLSSHIQETASQKFYLDPQKQDAPDNEQQDTSSRLADTAEGQSKENVSEENDGVFEEIQSLKRNVRRLVEKNESLEKRVKEFNEVFRKQMDELDIKTLCDRLDGQLTTMQAHLEEKQNSLQTSQVLLRQKAEKLDSKEIELEDKLEEVKSQLSSLQLMIGNPIPTTDLVTGHGHGEQSQKQLPSRPSTVVTLAELGTAHDSIKSQLENLDKWKDTMMNKLLPDLQADIKSQVAQLAGENELSATMKENGLKEAILKQQAAMEGRLSDLAATLEAVKKNHDDMAAEQAEMRSLLASSDQDQQLKSLEQMVTGQQAKLDVHHAEGQQKVSDVEKQIAGLKAMIEEHAQSLQEKQTQHSRQLEGKLLADQKSKDLEDRLREQQEVFAAQKAEDKQRHTEVERKHKELEDLLARQQKELEVHRVDKQKSSDGLKSVEEQTQNLQQPQKQSSIELATKLEGLQTECDAMIKNVLPKMQKDIEILIDGVSKDLSLRQSSLDSQLTDLEKDLAKQQGNLDARIVTLEKRSTQGQSQHEALSATVEKRLADQQAGLDVHTSTAEAESKTHLEGFKKQLMDLEQSLAKQQGDFDAHTDAMQKHSTKQQVDLQTMDKRLAEQVGKHKELENLLARQQKELEVHRVDKQKSSDGLKTVEEQTQNLQQAQKQSISELATKLEGLQTECDAIIKNMFPKMQKDIEVLVDGFSNDLSLRQSRLDSQLTDLEKHLAKQHGNLDDRIVTLEKQSAQGQSQHEAFSATMEKRFADQQAGLDAHSATAEKELAVHVESFKKQVIDLEKKLATHEGNFNAYTDAMQNNSTKQQTELQTLEKQLSEQAVGIETHKAACHQTWTQVEKDSSEQADGLKKKLADLEQSLFKQQGSLDAHSTAMDKHSAKQQAELQAINEVVDKRFAEHLAELDAHKADHKAASQRALDQEASTQLELRSLQGFVQELRTAQDEIISDKIPLIETHFQAQVEKFEEEQAKHERLAEELQGFKRPIEAHVRTLLANHEHQSRDLGGVADRVDQLEKSLQTVLQDQDEMLADTIPRIKADSAALQTEIKDAQTLQEQMRSQVEELSNVLLERLQSQLEGLSRSHDQQRERHEQLRQEGRRERDDLEAALLGKVNSVQTSMQACRDDQETFLGDIVPAMQAKLQNIDSSLQTCCDDQRVLLEDTVPAMRVKIKSIETRLQTCYEDIPAMQGKVKKLDLSLQRCCADQVGLRQDVIPAMQTKVEKIESSLQRCCNDQEGLLTGTIPTMQADAKEMERCLKDFGSLQDELVYSKLPEIETKLRLQVVKRLACEKAILEEQAKELWKKFEAIMDERQKDNLIQLETLVESTHKERYVELVTALENQQEGLAKLESSIDHQKQELVKVEIALESRRQLPAMDKTDQKPVIENLQQSVPESPQIMTATESGSITPRGRTPTGRTPRGRTPREHSSQQRSCSTGTIQKRTMHIEVVTPPGVPPPFSPASNNRSPQKNGLYRHHPCWHDCHLCSLGITHSKHEEEALKANCCNGHVSLFNSTMALTT
eukprot:TRINITY_DN4697_c0_g1_i1.p1 TRINITY_DN4697_c0_g1~~TRINITY_DN4697_c0_g1_i1.p1  ORF type:complete len:1614 (-),score=426.33 TRINITY_DN4697_c0_g1_i1:398-5113(-)